MMRSLTLVSAFVLAMTPASALAQNIGGLFNTGTDSSNVALAGGDGVTDPHYLIAASSSPGFAGSQAVTFVHPAYAPNDANSRWISISSTGTPGSNTTSYRLTFDLTGFDPLTAVITGDWGVDNDGAILINGVATGNTLTGGSTNNFNVLHAFTINSGFVAGSNFIDFVVTDLGAPTALRVDNLVGTARLVNGAIPEPATWLMMLLGFGAVGIAVRRQRALSLAAA